MTVQFRRRLAWVSSAPFGLAGGAGGVEDHGGVVAGAVGQRRGRARAAMTSCSNSPGFTRTHSAPASLAPASAASAKSCQANSSFAPGVLEVEAHLALLQQHVHRHHHAAGAQDPVVDDREVGDVREHQPDAVAGPSPFAFSRPAMRALALVEQRVGQLHVVELEGRAVAVLAPRSRSGSWPGSRSSLAPPVGDRRLFQRSAPPGPARARAASGHESERGEGEHGQHPGHQNHERTESCARRPLPFRSAGLVPHG